MAQVKSRRPRSAAWNGRKTGGDGAPMAIRKSSAGARPPEEGLGGTKVTLKDKVDP